MSKRLKELLIETPAPDGRVLFRSGAELARELAKVEYLQSQNAANDYYKKSPSAASYINQAFRDGRPLSLSLRMAIIDAVTERVHASTQDEELRKKWLKRVEELLWETRADNRDARHFDADDPVLTRMLELAAAAQEFVLVNTDSMRSSGDFLYREALIEKLGLTKNQTRPLAFCTFLENSEENAKRVWRNILFQSLGLSGSHRSGDADPIESPEDAAARIIALGDNDDLRVYVVPKVLAIVPIEVFDPLDKSKRAGFVPVVGLETTPSRVTAVELTTNMVRDWVDNVFLPVTHSKLAIDDIEIKRVRFKPFAEEFVAEATRQKKRAAMAEKSD